MNAIELLVVGAGPAGMAAALAAREQGVQNILILERGARAGGILNQCIHNGFGLHYFKEELTGPEYAHRFAKELERTQIPVTFHTMVLDIAYEPESGDKIVTAVNGVDGVLQLRAKAVVLAMGCRERARGALHIAGSRPAGILTAGAAQLFVNMEGYMPGKEVVVLGSGDIGLIMARRMTLEGATVKAVCELMPYSGGLQRNIVQCLEDFDIPLLLRHTVVEIHGEKRLTGVTVAAVDKDFKPIEETKQFIACDTLLLSVGLIPENELSEKAGVVLDSVTSGPRVNEAMETSVPGIFACGNVVHVHDLVDFVTLESRRAGAGAASYVAQGTKAGRTIQTQACNGVRYVVPQTICLENAEAEIQLFMRVKDVYRNVILEVRMGTKVVKSVQKKHMAPAEMETLEIKRSDLQGVDGSVLEVKVVEVDA